MRIYYEDVDNKLEECGETWLIPSNSSVNEEGEGSVA